MAEYGSRLFKALIAGMLCLFLLAALMHLINIEALNSYHASGDEYSLPTPAGTAKAAADGDSNKDKENVTTKDENTYDTIMNFSEAAVNASTKAGFAGTLRCLYYDEKDFTNSIITAEKSKKDIEDKLSSSLAAGGIVPHHLLAGKMIACFFQALAKSSPKTIVVIAPNHNRAGLVGIHACKQSWSTKYGTLDADAKLTDKLIDELGARQSTELMENDHSISALVPYIKYYMPDVKIVPIMLHGDYSADDSIKLGGLLADEMAKTQGTVIVASVDFSHYLDSKTAFRMDEKTLDAIMSTDIRSIGMMGNDNLDSPASVIALLTAMSKNGTAVPTVLDHSISSNFTGNGFDYTTSYFTMLFEYKSSNKP
jgi:hypothetical protein